MSEYLDFTEADNTPAELEVSEVFVDAVSPRVSTEPIEGGTRVTVTDIDGEKTFDVMDGKPGNPGDPGQDGISPTISVTEITGGHRVTVTDADGGHAFDVMDGEPGKPGNPGDPGQDGVSPTVTVTDITGGHNVTITDATGTHSFDVMDGEKGDKGDPGDDYTLTAADKQEIAGLVDVSGKMDEPATEGTAGQVLTTDGQGGRSWQTVQGGGGGGGIDLGIAGASADDFIKIASVDASGKPTAWQSYEWNHVNFSVSDSSEYVTAFAIPNSRNISQVLILGSVQCDSYDGFEIFIGNKRVIAGLPTAISATVKNVGFYIYRLNDIWVGVGSSTQWDGLDAMFKNIATPYERHDGTGDIMISSRWKNKTFIEGTNIDVWWR